MTNQSASNPASITEYQSLRDELKEIAKRQFEVATLGFPAVTLLIGYILSKGAIYCLLPIIPLFIMLSIWQSSVSSVFRILTYLRIFIEEDIADLKWETVCHRLRKHDAENPEKKKLRIKGGWTILRSFRYFAILIGFGCIMAAFTKSHDAFQKVLVISSLFFWLGTSAYFFWQLRSREMVKEDKRLETIFREFKKELKANHQMNVSLTLELEQIVNERLASGFYTSASEVMHEALSLLQQRDELRRLKLDQLREEVKAGAEQIKQGQCSKYATADELIAEITEQGQQRLAEKQKAHGQ